MNSKTATIKTSIVLSGTHGLTADRIDDRFPIGSEVRIVQTCEAEGQPSMYTIENSAHEVGYAFDENLSI